MKRFYCQCGNEVYFDNTCCKACNRLLGYDPARARLVSLDAQSNDIWQSGSDGMQFRQCDNRLAHGVCNGLVELNDSSSFCLACRLNRTIPDISRPDNLRRWARIELAKRRLIYGLITLNLPLEAPVAGFPRGLSFDFLEDQRSNPNAPDEFVTTGHLDGVITLNVLEADDVQRVWQQQLSSERYRTLLGHFRHEAGHYYYELLVTDHQCFLQLFGDASRPYQAAMKNYYDNGPLAGWEQHHISAYASSHPIEDWAECFAHYLHVTDALETARARGLVPDKARPQPVDEMLADWDQMGVSLNEMNRSLGLADAYPFVVTAEVAEKLRFVDAAIAQTPLVGGW